MTAKFTKIRGTCGSGETCEAIHAPEVLAASKFAVIELDVVKSYRGQGLGKALLQEILANRHERFATLAALPGTQAHAMYLRWGWRNVGIIGGAGPVMDAMLLPLRA